MNRSNGTINVTRGGGTKVRHVDIQTYTILTPACKDKKGSHNRFDVLSTIMNVYSHKIYLILLVVTL